MYSHNTTIVDRAKKTEPNPLMSRYMSFDVPNDTPTRKAPMRREGHVVTILNGLVVDSEEGSAGKVTGSTPIPCYMGSM